RAPRVSDRLRKKETGLPGWVVPSAILGLVAIALVGWVLFFKNDPTAAFNAADVHVAEGNYSSALRILEGLDEASFGPSNRERFGVIEAAALAGIARGEEQARNLQGFEYIQESIRRFHEKQIGQKDPNDPAIKPRARMLRERIAFFRAHWPAMPQDHEDVLMVAALDRDLAKVVDPASPYTLDDVKWNIYYWTGESTGAKKMFDEAFAVLHKYLATASGPDADTARNELARLEQHRDAYHAERMQDAKARFENGDAVGAAGLLEHSILHLGPGPHVDDAARRFVLLPNAAAVLRGYQKARPDTYAGLVANPAIAAFLAQQPALAEG
ncbi:MAG TPA: hypothetical protein VJP77_07875, partial [Planctomycetota bacterium]|nr:hypothetical protein [Planctomycetota bacterium]